MNNIVDNNQVKETLGRHILADGLDMVMDFERSHGAVIVDNLSGKEYLDMFSMFASAAVGYNHPYILKHQDWLGKHATYKPTLSDVYLQEYADFLKVFERVVIPEELQYCFFIEGGALAVENALKTAFDWKTRKNWQKGSKTEASMVIHFQQAFHGRSGYTLSLTNTADPRKHQYFPKFDWPRVINPKLTFPVTEENLAHTVEQEGKALLHIQEAILANPNKVACIIIEPIQAEGGDNHFRPEFFQELRRICDENEILLIFDEVQTGIGITGKMFMFQHIGVVPDIISFGKKTQVCGILASKEKLDEVEHHVFKESSRINSTFGGNFIDMLRLKLMLEIIENENLLENVQKQGLFLMEGLIQLQNRYPDYLSNARGVGIMCAIDFPSKELRNKVQQQLFTEEDILILPCGERSLRFRPHLNVQQSDLSKVLSAINSIVSKI
ncbi:L-lysine 6-transaminase [Elizabethkingia anophelis]|nr:L-lysine 6-transaminase [Elizabethkingia anophelis]MCT3950764.1 L-lysine 6-transaminase [Elizabethkingia anophelis]MCT3954307.1 L-lysine 6-transaminase [Elizabethkingia anophelis]MCT3986250.1 L-lysine 6-transaminase [Elizabethkingia anophelis]MCT4064434.1 L-lysine 6-transaminase [Elizabethkingia anophelis]